MKYETGVWGSPPRSDLHMSHTERVLAEPGHSDSPRFPRSRLSGGDMGGVLGGMFRGPLPLAQLSDSCSAHTPDPSCLPRLFGSGLQSPPKKEKEEPVTS